MITIKFNTIKSYFMQNPLRGKKEGETECRFIRGKN